MFRSIQVWLFAVLVVGCKFQSGDNVEEKTPVEAGGINDGNTGEYITYKNNPWFVGKKPASYCIVFGSNSATAYSKDARKRMIEQIDSAFKAWTDILQTMDPISDGRSNTPNGEFLAGDAVANLTRAFVRRECDQNVEIRVKIGTWDKEDRGFLQYTSRHTVAYALRTHYEETTGRSRGFIWLSADIGPNRYKGPAPDGSFWSQHHYLYNVMLHEVGHVFGLPHINMSFMDGRFPAGVLATSMREPWIPKDFTSLVGLVSNQCGLYHSELLNESDQDIIFDVFAVNSSEVKAVCWKPVDELRQGDENTPYLLMLKGENGKILTEQVLKVDGSYGPITGIGGNYLKKVGEDEYRYSHIIHVYYFPNDVFRTHFERNSKTYWLEMEVDEPGVTVFRFAYDGPWKGIVTTIMDIETHELLTKALNTISFDDDDSYE